MAAASILGGYLGARVALRVHPRQVRFAVIAIGFSLAAYFFYQKLRTPPAAASSETSVSTAAETIPDKTR
jgi:hypothetical protein